MVLIFGVFQVYFFSLVFFFNFSAALFVLLPVDFICSQARNLNELNVSMVPSD